MLEEALLEIKTAIECLERATGRLSSECAPDPQTALTDLERVIRNVISARSYIVHHLFKSASPE